MSAEDVGEVPTGVITVTFTAPVPDGLTAMMERSLSTVKLVAGTDPNSTADAPLNPDPVIVTGVPPAVEPLVGERAVTAGATAAVYVY